MAAAMKRAAAYAKRAVKDMVQAPASDAFYACKRGISRM
jgi:hypothetical protein